MRLGTGAFADMHFFERACVLEPERCSHSLSFMLLVKGVVDAIVITLHKALIEARQVT